MTPTDGINTSTLAYHHPEDVQFSLAHVTGDKSQHDQRVRDLDADDDLEVQTLRELIDGSDTYLIYTKDAPGAPLADFETEEAFVHWLREHFSQDNLQIALAVYRAFRGILREKADADENLTLYKQMELERIPEVVNRVEWRQPVAAVGAELLSEFILRHPMPNTNHRTGISLLERYLTSVDSSFSMPETGVDGEWYDWAADYIHDSKRLLTLRNDIHMFRYAAALGYQTVERKEGVTIELTGVDFETVSRETYEHKHRERTREFVATLLEESGATHLSDQQDDGKRAFVDRLRADQ